MGWKNFCVTLCISGLLLSSCGLMEFETEEIIPTEMHLAHDTLYVMVGDQLSLTPIIKPDSVTISDVFWTTSADSVLSVKDNVFTAVGEGWVMVHAISVSQHFEDSCCVNVMRRWEDRSRDYPYEMMVYADVNVHGKSFDPETMMLGAFVDDEIRGAGELMKAKDCSFVRFRVGSSLSRYSAESLSETVSFRVYYKQEWRYEQFLQTIDFDGETHGSLSGLFELKTDK